MNRSILDKELMIKSLDKIAINQIDENNSLSSIKAIFENLSNNYNSDNLGKIKNTMFELSSKFPTIKNIHANNVFVINHNIEKYMTLSKDVSNKFEDLGR